MRALLVIFALLCGPAFATQDAWPALFDVAGVSDDDVLNIRAEPSADAPIIGSLEHDATGVEVIEPSERHTWGRVNVGETSGWVSLSFLQRGPGQWFGAPLQPASCFGTEPFWDIAFDDDILMWSALGEESSPGRLESRIPGSNRYDREAMSMRFQDGRDGVAVLRLESCSDFMTDRAYGIAVDVILGTTEGAAFYSGCCSLSR